MFNSGKVRVTGVDPVRVYQDVDGQVHVEAGGAGKQAPRAATGSVGRRKGPVPYQGTGQPDAARLGASTGLTGLALCVAAVTWLLTTVAEADMPMVTRLIIITCLFGAGGALAWLGGRIERLGGDNR